VLYRTSGRKSANGIAPTGQTAERGMVLSVFTLAAAGMLGGALAVGLTALAVVAVAVLAVLAVVNGLRMVGCVWSDSLGD
jgi:hypothetical protein